MGKNRYFDVLDYSYFKGEGYVKSLKEWIKKSMIFIAIEKNEIVAFIDAQIKERPKIYRNKKEGHINLLYVKEEYRKKGIGTTLIKKVLDTFDRQDITFISVNTHASDKEANIFWKKKNFRKYNIKYVKEG